MAISLDERVSQAVARYMEHDMPDDLGREVKPGLRGLALARGVHGAEDVVGDGLDAVGDDVGVVGGVGDGRRHCAGVTVCGLVTDRDKAVSHPKLTPTPGTKYSHARTTSTPARAAVFSMGVYILDLAC